MTPKRTAVLPWTFNRGKLRGKPKLDSKYRSQLEESIAGQLEGEGVPFTYESSKFDYIVPARKAKYTPDFHLNGRIFIESKGYFEKAEDRQKLILFKQQHPEVDLRLVFQSARTKIYKGSPTTYGMWAESHGFLWADKGRIPQAWIEEAKHDQHHVGPDPGSP